MMALQDSLLDNQSYDNAPYEEHETNFHDNTSSSFWDTSLKPKNLTAVAVEEK